MIHACYAASETIHPRYHCYGSNNSLIAAVAATSVTNVLASRTIFLQVVQHQEISLALRFLN